MGKIKGGGKPTEKTAKQVPKCVCEDPFKCSCGNRPERPSKGHRWDPVTQQWGGKGHKQKGGSGQVSTIGAPALTTKVGKTTVAQWQKLPSALLDEFTKKDSRPLPIYKKIGEFKYRVIIQDTKVSKRGTDHDLIFVPAESCNNEEQAREDAALLALLHLTPNIPNERKLPEPYKTTWLHAVKAHKESKFKSNILSQNISQTNDKLNPKINDASPGPVTNNFPNGAKASLNLKLGNAFISAADERKRKEKIRQERNSRIQRHEAIRMANRDHQVFLSARLRKQIETLLRGEPIEWEEYSHADDSEETEMEIEDWKSYIISRLHSEGFSKAQAKTALSNFQTIDVVEIAERNWDMIHEECLQWLCIHLDEDQLPEGFDPRGRTLDVIVSQKMKSNSEASSSQAQHVATTYGITIQDALGLSRLSADDTTEMSLWKALCLKSAAKLRLHEDQSDTKRNLSILDDELEALQAIFSPEECVIHRCKGKTEVIISLPSEDFVSQMKMMVVAKDGLYPSIHPDLVLLSGSWSAPYGVVLHVKLIQFMSDLPLSEPMIFELFGHLQHLLQDAALGKLKQMALTIQSRSPQMFKQESTLSNNLIPVKKACARRPQESFWTVPPNKTPKVTSSPKIDDNIRRQREHLPAAKAKKDFLLAMQRSHKTGRVILVTGDTGCGKTTQIPQYILENLPGEAKIVVAQPRRLAATGVASRVANERGEKQPGLGSVGYAVRGDVAISESTRLLFCTTGILLRQLQREGALQSITHIVVDEVHERQLDTDILLGILKEKLIQNSHLNVVLMSATLDADRFAAYWNPNTPRLHIPGRTFPVSDFMLEDVLMLTGYIPPKKGKKKKYFSNRAKNYPRKLSPWADSEKSDSEEEEGEHQDNDTLQSEPSTESTIVSSSTGSRASAYPIEELVKRVDESNIDYDMIGILVKYLIQVKTDDGSILVFLPGAPEINHAMKAIEIITRGMKVDILPLHGGLHPRDQKKVFIVASPSRTKVILATNIAETSITIPDCTYVVDSCREKQSSYDPENRMPLLLERFASKASIKQRCGRAGRVKAGSCYKLISRETYESLDEHGVPEIHRCALDQSLLSLLYMGLENGSNRFLKTLLDPPSKASVDSAIHSLKEIGAVSTHQGNGSILLTPLGTHLSCIPAPPLVGKIMIMGSILGCRKASLAIAASMSLRASPFRKIDHFRQDIATLSHDVVTESIHKSRRELFHTVGNSDYAMIAAAYMLWEDAVGLKRRRYCDEMGLNIHFLQDMKQMLGQLDTSLTAAGYESTMESECNNQTWRIVRTCVVASLAPSHIVRVHRPSTKYAETIGGAKELDTEAKSLSFFIASSQPSNQLTVNEEGLESHSFENHRKFPEERVFIHPCSANFSTGNFNCPWLVYYELVRTSKAFLRDATECSAYALLLFGGNLEIQAVDGKIIVAGRIRLAANARIGALVGGLRKMIDELMNQKIQDPSFDVTSTAAMRLVRSLLVTDGLG